MGNTRAMFSKNAGTNQPIVLAQATDYYPFGKSFENNNVDKNRYLYNGKPKQIRDPAEAGEFQEQLIGGTPFGWYDYGARFYDPELGRWHSMDPRANSYYEHSPYHFSGNNPIKFIDLNGMNYDEYEFNDKGEIRDVKQTETDSFYKVDANGKRIDGVSLELDKKVVEGQTTLKTNEGTSVDFLKVTGDEPAKQIFEFVASNVTETKTEVGLAKVGNVEGDKGRNMIGVNTDHKESSTSANKAVLDNGYTIRETSHSHPSNNVGASQGDIAVAKLIQDKFPNAKLSNFTPKYGYMPYNKNSSYSMPSFNVNEFVITAKRRK